MLNNYNLLVDLATKFNYLTVPVFLIYKSRNKDTNQKSKFLDNEIRTNIFDINMSQIITYCEKYNSRCYLSFLDESLMHLLNFTGSRMEKFLDSCKNRLYKTSCLHLIDIDNVEGNNINKTLDILLDWLRKYNITYTYIMPTRTGQSLLFRSKTDLLKNYYTDLDGKIDFEANDLHLNAFMNLYIPDFYN